MDAAMWVAKTGLDAQQTRMTVISNNLANVNTTGFKRDRAVFEDLLYQNVRQPGGQTSANDRTPTGMMLGTGTRITATEKIHAQGNLIMSMFPDGATIVNLQGQSGASPAIDRNKGLHNVLDPVADKYKIVFEQTAGFARDKGLSVTEAALSGLSEPPKVIVAANDDMALGAMEAVKARGLTGIAIIGFDALPEALAQVRDGGLTATIEQFPGQQSALGVQTLVAFLKDGTKPAEKVLLLTPVAITKDNLQTAERLGEVK